MPSNNVTARYATQIGAGLFLLLAVPAQAIEYDGNWQFTLNCAAQGAQPAFADRFTAPIAQNSFTRSRASRSAAGLEDSSRFSGRVEAGQMRATLERARGNERWTIRLAGSAISDTRFDLPGGLFVGERQLRSCQLVAEALTSAPGSLAATAPLRAAAAQQQLTETTAQLAAAAAALAALQASSEARGDTLQTELDLARFEGAAMRNEMTQRSAALLVLTGRVQAAEAATTQAQSALAQAVAAAATGIGQRDQRLAAAAAASAQAETAANAQRSALEARATAAEQSGAQAQAALARAETAAAAQRSALEARANAAEQARAQAQAALARAETAAAAQRSALEARVNAAEQASAQAQAALARAETAAAAQRSALEARVTAAEQASAQAQAGIAQLRVALATAQRELAEARTSLPPR